LQVRVLPGVPTNNMKKETSKYLKIEDCIDGAIYEVDARNFSFGIFSADKKTFTGIRYKWGDFFLDEEYHWDYRKGTVRPFTLIEQYSVDTDFLYICTPEAKQKQTKLFNYLQKLGR
jgi:hypothetical protein